MPSLIRTLDRLPFYVAGLQPLRPIVADHEYCNVFLRSKRDLEDRVPIPLRDAHLLILGCGFRYPDVILYSTCSAKVAGLDTRRVFYRDPFLTSFRDHRQTARSTPAALYQAWHERNGARRYYRRLAELAGHPIEHRALSLESYDGKRSSFAAEVFDATLSNAVLQHVMDLPAFLEEAARVTKRGGLSYHVLHNYCSFSGSLFPESVREKDPWGHLRGIHEPSRRLLNRARSGEVVELFSRWFEVTDVIPLGKDHAKKGIDDGFRYEREDLLTAELRRELAAYPTEELLTRSYLLIGRKR